LEKLNTKPIEGMIYLEDIFANISGIAKLFAFIKSKLPLNWIKKIVHDGPENEISVILFTSGSEKEPKAVQLSHKNILHNLRAIPEIIGINSDDLFFSNLPLFHVFGLTVDFWLPLYLGGSLITYPNPLDYSIISTLVRKYKPTVMAGTPAFYYGYLKKSKPGDFSSLRIAVAGADKLTQHIYDSFLKKHQVKIYEGYGATETSPVISVNTPEHHKIGSVGKPLPGVEIKIIHPETEEELAPGQEGKILVKGDLVMEGYLGDLEETSLHIRKGWYDTGDMGVMDEDGFLWHRGRLKRFVKVGGEMVSLVKVESILEKYLPEDTVCCVVDVPNPTKGADIVAAIATSEIDKKKILKQMSKELPSIAVPKEIYYIEDIPMMGSGKVNFREVEKICREMQDKKQKKKSSKKI
jgi:acyl-[acyl-carrier-protein]-phospholipid O-acyltransferase/long-chain-fatty-acid--[acyl-carrier-protein] ligase